MAGMECEWGEGSRREGKKSEAPATGENTKGNVNIIGMECERGGENSSEEERVSLSLITKSECRRSLSPPLSPAASFSLQFLRSF